MPRAKPKSKKIKIKVVMEKPSFAKATAGKEKKAPQKKEGLSVKKPVEKEAVPQELKQFSGRTVYRRIEFTEDRNTSNAGIT